METEIEKVFFKDDDVIVTQSRFVVGNKTFAMRNISSVVNYEVEADKTWSWVLMIFGLLVTFGSVVFGIILIVFGILILLMTKSKFAVRINSNSGETNALESQSKDYVQEVVDAINQAMIFRG